MARAKKSTKKATKKVVLGPRERKPAPVKGLPNIWDVIKDGYTDYIDPEMSAKARVVRPWDVRVLISIPTKLSEHASHTVEIGEFFKRNPMANFTRVTFLYPNPDAKKKAGRQKKDPMKDILAVFDTTLFKDSPMTIVRKPNGNYPSRQSKAHALLLFKLFGIKTPTERGQSKELLLKLTPVKEGDDRESRKVCKVTVLRQLTDIEKQREAEKP